MDDVLATIRAFVAGEISPGEFRDRLYTDGQFETFLGNDPHLRASNYVGGSAYHFLLEQDLDDPAGVLNAQGALADFMDRNGITYTRTAEYHDLHLLLLETQPDWLDVDAKYVHDHILPAADERTGKELRRWLRAEFESRFRYVAAPPEWLQSTRWPIGESGPLVFLGQLPVRDYFHDTAAVYVFHDPHTGQCQTILQVM